jgi:predicted transposase/invertase (TIGR01784 family)
MAVNKNKARKSSESFVFMNPRTDFGFKKIFENEVILISFLNEMLPEKIVHIQYLLPEQLGFKLEDRKAVYDIYCKNDKGKCFIVEMQATPQPHFVERGLFYASHSILSQAPKGKVIRKNKEGVEVKVPWDYSIDGIYVVGILDFELFTEESAGDIVVEHIQLIRQKANLRLTDKFGLVTIELPKFKKEKEDLITLQDKWLYTLKNMESLPEYPEEMKESIFKELYKKASIENLTEKEMKTYQKSVLEYDDVILSMNYVEELGEKRGIAIGEKRGVAIGEKRGVAIGEKRGIAIGEKRGVEKEQIKFVQNCYRHSMSIEEIAKLTDLKVEQIAAILAN